MPRTLIVFSVDPAAAAGHANSFTVIQVWTSDGDRHYLIDQWREQAGYRTVKRALKALAKKYNPAAILIERTGFGSALCEDSRYRKIIEPVIPDHRSKLERLTPHRNLIRQRKIALVEQAPYVDELIQELVNFEIAQFTDQGDALTQYLDFMSLQPRLVTPVRGGLGAGAYGSLPQVEPSLTAEQAERMNGTAILTRSIDRLAIDAKMHAITTKYLLAAVGI